MEHFKITELIANDNEIRIEGYAPNFRGLGARMTTTIRKTTLQDFLASSETECHEGHNLVIVNPTECQMIDVDLHTILSSATIQDLEKKNSIDIFKLGEPNVFCNKQYMGLPAIVYMTFMGMLTIDI